MLGGGWMSGRAVVELDEEAFKMVVRSQSEKAQRVLRDIGVESCADMRRKAQKLALLVNPATELPREWQAPTAIFPGCVFTHACELAQLLEVVPEERIKSVGLRADRLGLAERVKRWLADEMSPDGPYRSRGITVTIFEQTELSLRAPRRRFRAKKPERLEWKVKPKPAGRKGQPQGKLSMKMDARRVGQPRGTHKQDTRCERCGKRMRKDNLARHQDSVGCVPINNSG